MVHVTINPNQVDKDSPINEALMEIGLKANDDDHEGSSFFDQIK